LAVYVIVCSVSECTAVIGTETRMETDLISSRKCSKKSKPRRCMGVDVCVSSNDKEKASRVSNMNGSARVDVGVTGRQKPTC